MKLPILRSLLNSKRDRHLPVQNVADVFPSFFRFDNRQQLYPVVKPENDTRYFLFRSIKKDFSLDTVSTQVMIPVR